MHQEQERPPEGRGKKRRRRLRPFEMIVMAIGYGTILYWIVRGLVYVAVLLAH